VSEDKLWKRGEYPRGCEGCQERKSCRFLILQDPSLCKKRVKNPLSFRELGDIEKKVKHRARRKKE